MSEREFRVREMLAAAQHRPRYSLSGYAYEVARRRGINWFDAKRWLSRSLRSARPKPRPPRASGRSRRIATRARRVARDDGDGGSEPAPRPARDGRAAS